MAARLIFQGFTALTHKAAIERVLALDGLERAILSAAFVNGGGVGLMADTLRPLGAKVDFYAGIRNDITSRQALEGLIGLKVRLVTVDTGSTHLTFHPKLYYSRSADAARLVIGSANFTPGGLNNNIEASLAVDIDLGVDAEAALANEIEALFDGLEDEYPDHVTEIGKASDLLALQAAGRLIDQSEVVRPIITRLGGDRAADSLTKIKLKTKPVTGTVSPIKIITGKTPTAQAERDMAARSEAAAAEAPSGATDYVLVWESKPLTERDLNIPKGASTNQTGSMNLDKGLMAEDVDHRHYFRDEVFDRLTWRTRSATVDEATAIFRVVVKGNPVGEFPLWIRHTTSTNTRSYEQFNAMTRLSWGDLRPIVQQEDLLGRHARLYRSLANPKAFLLEID